MKALGVTCRWVTGGVLAGVLIAATGLAMTVAPSKPQALHVNPFNGTEAVSDDALHGMRGGLMIKGMDFQFAVTIRTVVSDAMELVTELRGLGSNGWQSGRIRASRQNVNPAEPTATPQQAVSSEGGGLPSSGNTTSSNETTITTERVLTRNDLSKSGGFSASIGDSETTEIIHQISKHGLGSIVKNRENQRIIESATEFDINFKNHNAFSKKIQSRIRANRIMRDMTDFGY